MNKAKELAKLISGIGILIISYYLGELLSHVVNGFISPSVMGMLLLFLFLKTGIVKPVWVQTTATFLLDHLMLFFIPAIVGIGLISYSSVKDDLIAIAVAASLSTLMVLWIVGFIIKKFEQAND